MVCGSVEWEGGSVVSSGAAGRELAAARAAIRRGRPRIPAAVPENGAA